MKNSLLQSIGIKLPILQAPMAGITTPGFVAEVSNNNCLGNIGAGYLNPEKTKEFVLNVKELTKNPFGINLFVPENKELIEEKILKTNILLEKYRKKLQITEDEFLLENNSEYEEKLEIVLQERVKVCSFTFGIPSKEIVMELKKNGTFVIGTATNVREAQIIESIGMDAVVAQGSEAGGHRGAFINEESLIGTMSLIPQVVDNVAIPVIAAGGIMDGRGLTAALCLGAEGVQFGTAFLTTKESGAHRLHKEAVLVSSEEEILLTKAFSGKTARGINNQFIEEMKQYEEDIPSYPYQNALTKEIRRVASVQNDKEYMSLWSGQSPRLSKDMTVQELIHTIHEEVKQIKNNGINIKV